MPLCNNARQVFCGGTVKALALKHLQGPKRLASKFLFYRHKVKQIIEAYQKTYLSVKKQLLA